MPEDGQYVLTRDVAIFAILKEVETGRGSPHGGVFLSFDHCSELALRAAFGPGSTGLPLVHTLKATMADGVGPQAGRWETYQIPFEPRQSVLDGLRWIRVNHDPTLAIRFSCINANACKECLIELDGHTVYACTARLEAREMTLASLSNKPLVRDLVTEIAPPAERFG